MLLVYSIEVSVRLQYNIVNQQQVAHERVLIRGFYAFLLPSSHIGICIWTFNVIKVLAKI